MSKQKQVHTAQNMPSNEALQLSGIRELSREELFKVNGGRQVEGAISSYGPDPGSSSSSNENYVCCENDFADDDEFGSSVSSGSSASSSEIGSSDSSGSSGSSSSYGSDSDHTGGYTDCPEAGYTDCWEGAYSGGYGNSGSSDTGGSSAGSSDNASQSWTFNEGEETSPTQGGGSPRTHWNSSSNEAASGSSSSGSSDNDYSNSGSSGGGNKSSGNSYYTRPAWKTGKNTVEADFNHNAEFEGDSYIVRSGDTLSTIVSKKYPGASEAEIRRLVREVAENSGITNVNRIEVGQTIFFTKPADASAKTGTGEKKADSTSQAIESANPAKNAGFLQELRNKSKTALDIIKQSIVDSSNNKVNSRMHLFNALMGREKKDYSKTEARYGSFPNGSQEETTAWGWQHSLSKNTKKHINKLHPDIRTATTNMMVNLYNTGVNVEIVSSIRSFAEQDKLYSIGRGGKDDNRKTVTKAKGGESFHNYGLAFDVEVYDHKYRKNWNTDSADWQKVIAEGQAQGFEAGATWEEFKDYPHFENGFGLSTKQLLERINNNQTEGGFVYVK